MSSSSDWAPRPDESVGYTDTANERRLDQVKVHDKTQSILNWLVMVWQPQVAKHPIE